MKRIVTVCEYCKRIITIVVGDEPGSADVKTGVCTKCLDKHFDMVEQQAQSLSA